MIAESTNERVIYRSRRIEMRAFLPEKFDRVLEVGCDEGDFLADTTNETWGVEPVAQAAASARSRMYKVLEGTFDSVCDDLPLEYFDVVVCNDVIEHMPDHHHFLRKIRRHMKPEGVLIGSIPNVRFYRHLYEVLILKDWKYRNLGVLDRTHLRFFTERSLRRDLIEAGFHIEIFKGINGGLRRMQFGLVGLQIFRALFACLLLGLTLGGARDILYIQFGFRVVKQQQSGGGDG